MSPGARGSQGMVIPTTATPGSAPDQAAMPVCYPRIPPITQNIADHPYRLSIHIGNTQWSYLPVPATYRGIGQAGGKDLTPLEDWTTNELNNWSLWALLTRSKDY